MSFYPLINKKEIKVKETENRVVLFIKDLNDKTISLNESARYIFDWSDGTNSIDDIVNKLLKLYKLNKSYIGKVENDVYRILNIFDKYGIIVWKKRNNPFFKAEQVNDLSFYKIGLSELYKLKEKYEYELYNVKTNKDLSSSKTLMKQGMFSKLIHTYYIEKNNKPYMLIMIQIAETNNIWEINKILLNAKEDIKDDLNTVFSYISNNIKRELYNNDFGKVIAFKLDVFLSERDKCLNLGFEEKGCLKNELEQDLYSMWRINND